MLTTVCAKTTLARSLVNKLAFSYVNRLEAASIQQPLVGAEQHPDRWS
jgi:hypothetical protein